MVGFRSAQEDDRRAGDFAADAHFGLVEERLVVPTIDFRRQIRVLLLVLLPGEGDGLGFEIVQSCPLANLCGPVRASLTQHFPKFSLFLGMVFQLLFEASNTDVLFTTKSDRRMRCRIDFEDHEMFTIDISLENPKADLWGDLVGKPILQFLIANLR